MRPVERQRCRLESDTKQILKNYGVVVYTGFIWLRIGRCGLHTVMNFRVL
jgi:hypothetical protein